MKRIGSLILAVCIALSLAVPAFADGRGPAFTSYDVVCDKDTPFYTEEWKNDNGTMVQKGTIPAGTVLTVEYEYDLDGVLYGSVTYDLGDMQYGYIRVSDTHFKNEGYQPQADQKLASPCYVRVIAREGVKMYAGPNTLYPTVTTIPYGTDLTYTYGNDPDVYYRTWAYVKYRSYSGWIYVLHTDTENGIAELPEPDAEANIWVLDDGVKLFGGTSFGNIENELLDVTSEEYRQDHHAAPDRVLMTLVKGKKYAYKYYHTVDEGNWYFITAGLRSGWVFMSHSKSRVAVAARPKDKDKFRTFRTFDLPLYDAPDSEQAIDSVHVEANTCLPSQYVAYKDYEACCYQTFEDQKTGWYNESDLRDNAGRVIDAFDRDYYNDRVVSMNGSAVYTDMDHTDKAVGTIPTGKRFEIRYVGFVDYGDDRWETVFYVGYNGMNGWIFEEKENGPEGDPEKTTAPEEESETTEWFTEEAQTDAQLLADVTQDAETEPGADAPQNGGLTAAQRILLCVAAAVVLTLTAGVMLVLIRRKRKAPEAQAQIAEEANEPAEEPATEETPEEADEQE